MNAGASYRSAGHKIVVRAPDEGKAGDEVDDANCFSADLLPQTLLRACEAVEKLPAGAFSAAEEPTSPFLAVAALML